ncbi:MAG: response regulator [Desulfobacterales bacterium]
MDCEPSRILIVEDEEAHAQLTQRAIRKSGNANHIDIVYDGEQALDYLYNRGKYADKNRYPCPGLVLLDIKLPGIDGIEVLKQIKEHPRLRQIPVIMLTTSEREEDVASAYGHYANSYLTKPVGFKEFEEKIGQLDFYWLIVNESPIIND